MTCELQVESVGVCLNVVHPDKNRVAVLLPDARFDRKYKDGRTAEPHVGYLRYDLAFVDSTLPLGDLDDPKTALLHQLNGEVIDFGLTDDGNNIGVSQLYAPQLEWTDTQSGAARDVELIPGLFGPTPNHLLARYLLTNGQFEASADSGAWSFSQVLRKKGEVFEPRITHKLVWKRTLREGVNQITLTVKKFDGTLTFSTVLQARQTARGKDVIRIKIANLCAGDPLEWEPFPDPTAVNLDTDFKWVYNLVESKTGTIKQRLGTSALPVPHRKRGSASVRNCPGAQINATF